MFKKILSLAIVAMLLMSLIAIGASAAQVDEEVAAEGAEVGEEVVATGDGSTINFDNSVTNWDGGVSFYAYAIEDPDDKPFGGWGAKSLKGTDDDGDNIWSYDASALESGKQYCIIFLDSATGLQQTYDLVMDTSCFGDTAKATGNKIENPVDSTKKTDEAKWASNSLGPRLQVTSIGSVVGETIPSSTSGYQMLVNFIASKDKDGLANALKFNGKDAQTTIDEVAAALKLTQADVKKALEEAKTTGNPSTGDKSDYTDQWDASKSSLPAGDSGTTSSTSTTSSKASSTAASTSSKTTGTATNTQTGQEETVLFIMLGVMVAAAGVIFFLRKKERA